MMMDNNEPGILKSSPVAFYSCNLKGEITFFNIAAEKLWGRKPTLGKDLWCGAWKTYYEDGTPLPIEKHPAAIALKTKNFSKKSEVKIERPDHSFRVILIIPQPDFNHANELVGAHFYIIDSSEFLSDHIKKATLSAIVETSDDAIISKDLNGTITSWNAGAQRIFGYTEAEALGRHITMLIPKSRLHEEDEIISKLKKGERIDHFETIRLDQSGRPIAISLTISPIKNIHGEIVGASKVARDISEHVQNHEKKEILSAIVESSDDAIISKDLEGTIMSWNKGAQKIFGYSEKEAVGNPITMLIPKDKLQEENHIISRISQGEKIDHFETVRMHKSGREIQVSITVSPVKNHKGVIVGASKVARDITLQAESKKALENYSRNLEVLNSVGKSISENLNFKEILQRVIKTTTELTHSQIGVFFYEVENPDENHSYFAVSGAKKADFEKLEILRFQDLVPESFHKTQVFIIKDIDERLPEKHPMYEKLKLQLGYKSYMAVPLLSKTGLVIGGFFFGHAEKDHFTSEDRLLVRNIASQTATTLQNSYLFEQVKNLSAKKDEFIAVASHELKTPLTSVKGYLQLLGEMNNDEKTGQFIEKSLSQVDKLNSLIEDLLNMSRLETGRLEFHIEKYDINEMLKEVIGTFNYSSQDHVIEHNLDDNSVVVTGDGQRIEQVVINLISNAIKYSPHANRVQVKLENFEDRVKVSVRDYGIGISSEHQKNLFERFYRVENSKGIGGLGIGLYLSKQIIDRHNGEIGVSSEYGEGSEFYFILPKENTRLRDRQMNFELVSD